MKAKKSNGILVNAGFFLGGVVVTTILAFAVAHQIQNKEADVTFDQELQKFARIQKTLKKHWFFRDEVDFQKQFDKALKAYVSIEKDPHTTYYDKKESDHFKKQTSNTFVGVGISYTHFKKIGGLVMGVFDNSPAKQAGILPGDIILEVDGRGIGELETDEIRKIITGKNGTTVKLKVQRGEEKKVIPIQRGIINTSVKVDELGKEVGYIRYHQFADDSVEAMKQAVEKLKDKKHLILDLRGNPGGSIAAFAEVASLFLPPNELIMVQKSSDGTEKEIRTLDNFLSPKKSYKFEKIMVLVDRGTASASEILSLVFRESVPGSKLIGEKTFGKGTAQLVRELKDETIFKYTTSQWYSKNRQLIDHKGIIPDITIENLGHDMGIGLPDADNKPTIDQVSPIVEFVQKAFTRYQEGIDRTDGYFSEKTNESLTAFARKHQLNYDRHLNRERALIFVSRLVYQESQKGLSDDPVVKVAMQEFDKK